VVAGWLMAAGFGVWMLVAGRGEPGAVVAAGVAWLSWVAGGLSALSLAHDRQSSQDGLGVLVLQRGHELRALSAARVVASMATIARVTGIPALGLALLGLAFARSLGALGSGAVLAVGVVGFTVVLGVALGAVARAAAALSPSRGRTWFLVLALGPELVQSLWPRAVSLPGCLGLAYRGLLAAGGGG